MVTQIAHKGQNILEVRDIPGGVEYWLRINNVWHNYYGDKWAAERRLASSKG